MLLRGTNWRQGHVLKDEDAFFLGLVESLGTSSKIVIITHDCDIPSDKVQNIEYIRGTLVQTDKSFTRAKNPRLLHLQIQNNEGTLDSSISLNQENKSFIKKSEFVNITYNDENIQFNDEEKKILKQWLAGRYGRPAFPDAFEIRFKKYVSKRQTLEQKIAKILSPISETIVGVFFNLGNERFIDLEDGIPYYLSILIVYDAVEGGPDARMKSEKAAAELETLLLNIYGAVETATEIGLEKCSAVADNFLTLADIRKLDQWRLEYISLEGDEEFMSIAETPL